ncbi:hypothetical protein HZQ28_17535 [Elizabethkingia anophelis]|uniref:hypothetical protein n=1 Tax=Elizabethkingia anophelis TaxID=1117645 RepID=UPI001365D319|nr:hypothetical protein [Elizabethkingia anophelis]MCT3946675.1 hypothetical protein [Elizabethkingia anophelis]MCT3996289.1 hypothetical protein [Elizabethkingia anophelis]MCT3999944.1 hypothetical protein [Elizabethkingia anophelis]MCT4256505.1 hypothetical protein [Elizabethkingia anophelis]MDV3876167.1 hypothetical protein [Elizabethkingia anophelis]
MSTFAKLKLVASYKKVRYYSVTLAGSADDEFNDRTLFENFFHEHSQCNSEKLKNIVYWLKEIGDTRGALEEDFRAEKAAHALPPPKCTVFIGKGKKNNNLRLYCLRANESVVFLFSGDVKTEGKAQNCPNVKGHFELANKLANKINQSFGTDLSWNDDYTDIDFNEDFIFEI